MTPNPNPNQGTGQETFLNAIIAASQGWVDSRNDPAQAVRYGTLTLPSP